MNLNFADRFSAEIVQPKVKCETAVNLYLFWRTLMHFDFCTSQTCAKVKLRHQQELFQGEGPKSC